MITETANPVPDNALTVLKDTRKALEEFFDLHKEDKEFDKDRAEALMNRIDSQLQAAEKRNPLPDDPDALIPPQEEGQAEEPPKEEEKLTGLQKIEKGIAEVEMKLKEIIQRKVTAQHLATVMEQHQKNASKLLSRLKEARRTMIRQGAK